MKTIITLFSLLILAGCVRTYHVYNYVSETSSLTQTIKVDAEASHPVQIDTNLPVGP